MLYFLDASYAIALVSVRDKCHTQAVSLAQMLAQTGATLVTTRAVLLEIGNALSKQRYRSAAIQLLIAIEADPNIEIVPLEQELYIRALRLYRERLDKEWGLVDCISFIIMQERFMQNALTADKHFVQAGFRALLQDEG